MSGTRGGGGAEEKKEEEEWQEQAWAKVGGHEREIKTDEFLIVGTRNGTKC